MGCSVLLLGYQVLFVWLKNTVKTQLDVATPIQVPLVFSNDIDEFCHFLAFFHHIMLHGEVNFNSIFVRRFGKTGKHGEQLAHFVPRMPHRLRVIKNKDLEIVSGYMGCLYFDTYVVPPPNPS